MHIFLQNLASIQPITSLVKFARSPRTDPPGAHFDHESGEREMTIAALRQKLIAQEREANAPALAELEQPEPYL